MKSSAPASAGPPVDQAKAGDEPIGGGGVVAALGQAACEGADFDEAAEVEQRLDPLPCIQLAAGVVLGDALIATH